MIIMRLMGGLGNQMFQYALGRRLALERGVPVKLDISWYEEQNNRNFGLNNFSLKVDIATKEEIFSMMTYSSFLPLQVANNTVQKLLPYYKRKIVKEQRPGWFDTNILRCTNHTYLTGYWQKEKYFQKIEKIIRKDFSPRQEVPQKVRKTANLISSNPGSVSIHVRHGDYKTEFNQLYAACSIDYYHQSISYISAKINNPHFYIFSDDFEWTKKNLILNANMTFIEPDTKIGAFMDMYLMSQCRHHINANSSFSWWGAWLGEQPGSVIIVPKRWFADNSYPKDTIPERWIKL